MFNEAALRALIMTTIAGLSTLLGMIFVFFTKFKNEKILTASLGFAAGVMLCVSFTELYPNGSALLCESPVGGFWGNLAAVASIAVGIAFAALIDRFVPRNEFRGAADGSSSTRELMRVGLVSTLAIGIHNFPEGIATFMAGYGNPALGLSVTVAIALHNIPEGLSVALPVYCATGSRRKAFIYTFLSGIAEPLGALAAFMLLRPLMSNIMLGCMLTFVAGIMIYISLEELLPCSRKYGHGRIALISTFCGIMMMLLTYFPDSISKNNSGRSLLRPLSAY